MRWRPAKMFRVQSRPTDIMFTFRDFTRGFHITSLLDKHQNHMSFHIVARTRINWRVDVHSLQIHQDLRLGHHWFASAFTQDNLPVVGTFYRSQPIHHRRFDLPGQITSVLNFSPFEITVKLHCRRQSVVALPFIWSQWSCFMCSCVRSSRCMVKLVTNYNVASGD